MILESAKLNFQKFSTSCWQLEFICGGDVETIEIYKRDM